MIEKTSGKQEMEADVVIVGYGGAGATAAITAYDHTAKVIILEKMAEGGGNTRLAGAAFLNPAGMAAVQHIEAICYGKTDRKVIQAFVESAMKNKEWIEKMGGRSEGVQILDVLFPFPQIPSWPNVPGAEAVSQSQIYRVGREREDEYYGERLWRFLSANVERRGIRVMTNTPAKEIVTNQKGEVVGVIAEREGEKVLIKAKRATILTCGGFEYNETMKEAFLPLKPLYPYGSPGNTGDGIIMAQKVGAALWHMDNFQGYFGFKVPEREAAFQIRFYGPRFIYVNKDGWRFTNETGWEAHDVWRAATIFDPSRPCYPHLPIYAIFDEVTRRRGPLYQASLGIGRNRDYRWSLDNSEEVAKGWISQGKTVRELATRISLNESILEDTVAGYNEYCKVSRDTEFGRSKETLEPIETSPYYAIELWPCLINTQGGPRRDEKARVLDNEGKPIPRLYSAGELGSIWGFLYCAPGNITECLAFGRIAGRNAAAENSW